MRRTTWLWSVVVLVGCLLSISLARSRIVAVYSNNPSCVDWVVYRAHQLTWEPGIQADAYQWILYALATGHVLGTDPVPLSIAVWEKDCESANPEFGHVAFVESINTDGTFNITEFNWGDCSGSYDHPCNRPDVENAECIWFIHNPVLPGGPELASNVEVSEYDVHPGLAEAEIQFSVLNTSPNETLDPSFWIVGGGIGGWGLWWVSSNADFVTCDGCDDPIPPGETRTISFHINVEGWLSNSRWDGDYHVEYIRFEDWGGRYQLNNSSGYTLGQCFNVCYNCLQGTQSTQRIEALESGSCPDYCSGSPTPADSKQCSDLTICPSNPQVDETVTFSFDVCNDGGQSVTFQNIGPQGHGPPDGQGGLWNVFAHDITVGAGQTVNVSASRSFEWEGTWCIEHVPTQDQDGNWHDLPANGYMQAQCFDVSSSPSPADLRQASDLQVSPAYPVVDQEVTFSYAVKNYGGESITIDTIIPQGHAYDDGQQTGLWNVPSHNITVGPGETVNINAHRSFEWEATWCIEHIPVLDQNGVWFDLPANGYMQAQCFNVGPVIPQAEYEALVALYNSTNGANWSNNSGWLDTNTPCNWYGVTCSAGHVTELSLVYNQLNGSIPPELGNLANLTQLHLYYNQLSGNIPPELGSLANLQSLYLGHNQLSGSIPPELGNLANLQGLYLYENQLSGSIPPELGNLADLRSLELYDNQLSGSIPAELGNLANLLDLWLHTNQLSGSIPPELGNLTNLQELYLGINQLTGSIPPELGNLTNLQDLYLVTNQLTGSIPTWLGNLANLRMLWLGGNPLSGSIPSELGNLANLRSLLLSGNQLSGSIPSELGNLANLHYLTLSGNQLSGSIPPELGNLTNLQHLRLYGNQLSGSIPPELGNLANLSILELDSNQLSGSIPPQLGNLVKLDWLFLHDNQLSGSIPPQLGNLTDLTWLDLSSNQLSGSIPPELGDLINLEDLRLNSNQFSGALPGTLTNLVNLDTFYFHNTDLCEPADAAFQTWLAGISDLSSTDVICGRPYTLTLVAHPTTLTVGETSSLTATVKDYYDNNVADGTVVTFTTSLGAVGSQSVTKTTTSGVATATLTSQEAGTASVTAMADSKYDTAYVTFNPGPPSPTGKRIQIPRIDKEEGWDTRIQIQNVGDAQTGVIALFWEDYSSVCPPSAPGPVAHHCQLIPGNWGIGAVKAEVPAEAKSAILYSVSDYLYEAACEAASDYEAWGSWEDTYAYSGEPLAVTIDRLASNGSSASGMYNGLSETMLGSSFLGKYFATNIMHGYNGLDATLTIQHSGDICASVWLYYKEEGNCEYMKAQHIECLAPGEAIRIGPGPDADTPYPGTNPGEPGVAPWLGSAYITANVPLSIVVDRWDAGSTMLMTHAAVPYPDYGDTTNYAPLVYRDFDGWDAEIQVLNMTQQSEPTFVTVEFFDQSGDSILFVGNWVCRNGTDTFYLSDMVDLGVNFPSGYVGAAEIQSHRQVDYPGSEATGPPIASVVSLINSDSGAALSYNALIPQQVAGATTFALPLISKQPQATSKIIIRNNSNCNKFWGRIWIWDETGTSVGAIDVPWLHPKHMKIVDLAYQGWLPAGFVGAATFEVLEVEQLCDTDHDGYVDDEPIMPSVVVLDYDPDGSASGQEAFPIKDAPVAGVVVKMTPFSPVKAETVEFEATFPEQMNTAVAPTVTIGVYSPYTDYTIAPETGAGYTNGYLDSDPTKWYGTYTFTDTMGDGMYHISIAGAEDSFGNPIATDTRNMFILDTAPPSSSVTDLPTYQSTLSFSVSWSGSDATSGIASYDVQYRDGTGSWTDWLTETTETSATFTGEDGHTYYFQCRARDSAGNVEDYPGGYGDTHTTVDITAPTPITITISPLTTTIGISSTFTVDVVIEAGDQPVDGVEAHLDFDSDYLTVIDADGNPTDSIIGGTTFPHELQNSVDNSQGTIDYAAGILVGEPLTGTITLATIRFQAITETLDSCTPITFVFTPPRKTDVVYEGQSVLDAHTDGCVSIEGGACITGAVTLQGRPEPPDPSWSIPATFTLYPPGGVTPIDTFTPTTDESGTFTVCEIPPATYDLCVKNAHTLSNKKSNVDTAPGPNSTDLGTLREGDTNDDDCVNITDFSFLRLSFAKCAGDPEFNPGADFNEDGCVNISDFSLLRMSFGECGECQDIGAGPLELSASGSTISANTTVSMSIVLSSTIVWVDDIFTVDVVIEAGDQSVDGAEAHIDFDPAYLTVVDSEGNPTDSIIGGSALPTPIQNSVDNGQGKIDYAAGILSGEPPTGTFTLATVRFKTKAHTSTAGTPLSFTFSLPRKTDVVFEGYSVLGDHTDGNVKVYIFGDFNGDCEVNVDDIMLVANCWRMTTEDPDCAPYDLDGDGIITVVDIMKVVAHWGETC